jgi:uncharacterized protein
MRVASIEHAVIKGAGMRAIDHAILDGAGIRDDRRFVLFDRNATQLYAHRSPSLCGVQAELDGDTLTVRLPGGETARGKVVHGRSVAALGWDDVGKRGAVVEGPFAPLLSRHLRRPVWLLDLATWEGRGMDVEPLTLVSTTSIGHLASQLGLVTLDHRRFRATLVLTGAAAPHEEDEWIGSEVAAGDVRLHITGPIPRCAVITRDPDTGRRDADSLRAIQRYRGTFTTDDGSRGIPFGVYARVVRPGRLSVGDPVDAEASYRRP